MLSGHDFIRKIANMHVKILRKAGGGPLRAGSTKT